MKVQNLAALQMADKLERYENMAYDGGFGSDWLAEIGESLKFYFEHCAENGESATMRGFIREIDQRAKKANRE